MDAHRLYLDVISGRSRGPFARLARLGLTACVPFYHAASRLYGLTFDRGWRTVHAAPVPVISVGNLSTGGTGKTPTVAWIVNWLVLHSMRPAILSRGYKSIDAAGNDEKRLLDAMCPGVPHLQNRDRAAAAQQAARAGSNVIVLDDGFQHRRLARDLDLVLIDAVNPWGYGHLLPRGLLREPRSALRRADLVLITRSDQVDSSTRRRLHSEIRRWTTAPVCTSRFEPTRWIGLAGETADLDSLSGQRAAAFCGIGNPEGFRRTLAAIGIRLTEEQWQVFPDHHHYDAHDIRRLNTWADAVGAECLLTTRKDLVKLSRLNGATRPIRALDITLEIDDPHSLISRLQALIGGRSLRKSA